MADLIFAQYTNSILNMLPYWFKIRKQSGESLGARFLNISGLELDDARYVLDYAYAQCYMNTIDIDQVDCCYKAIVPMPLRVGEIKNVYANATGLFRANDIKEFFGIDQHGIRDKNLHSFEYYYIDEKRNIIYVRQKFCVDASHDNGKIRIVFKNNSEREYKLVPHQVWNFFDEIGALVSCPRLPMEPNFEYKIRIMDVFINPANSSKSGLINGIGRELATRRVVRWEDPRQDFEIQDPMVVLNSITLDKKPVSLDRVFITGAGTVVVKGNPIATHRNCALSYVWGLEMHQLYNHEDIKLYNELFTVEGRAKKRLKRYIDILNSESPIFWDYFHWNEHYWDQNESDVSGVGFIPHLYDGSINGFKQYGIVEPQIIHPNSKPDTPEPKPPTPPTPDPPEPPVQKISLYLDNIETKISADGDVQQQLVKVTECEYNLNITGTGILKLVGIKVINRDNRAKHNIEGTETEWFSVSGKALDNINYTFDIFSFAKESVSKDQLEGANDGTYRKYIVNIIVDPSVTLGY